MAFVLCRETLISLLREPGFVEPLPTVPRASIAIGWVSAAENVCRNQRHQELVVQEVSRGDAVLAADRLESISGYPVLLISPAARSLADSILRSAVLSSKAAADALHIAVAAVNGMNFLTTWNCTHIANGFILQRVNAICRSSGFEPPIVCTPEELMEG